MRAVLQRVSRARVVADGAPAGRIGHGLLAYAAAAPDDVAADVEYIADKVAQVRLFHDDAGKMNRNVREAGGGVLLVSAFTVYADARRGRRPSFDAAAPAEVAERLLADLASAIARHGVTVEMGVFRAAMEVDAVNDGPICVLLDSRRAF